MGFGIGFGADSTNTSYGSNTQTGYNNTQTQQGSAQQNILPDYIQNAANYNLDQGMQRSYAWDPALQSAPAGLTPEQISAYNIARGTALGSDNANPAGQDATNAGAAGYQQVLNYNPQQVQGQTYNPAQMSANGYNAYMLGPAQGYQAAQVGPIAAAATQGYNAATIDPSTARGYTAQTGTATQQDRSNIQNVGVQSTPSQLPGYLQAFDPSYQTAVINASMNDLDRARQLTQQSNAGQAAQAGAFGDSRQGVMDAQTNDAYLRNVANLSANLRQQGFNTALSSLQGDTANTLQSQLANQQADIGVSANNAGFQNQFGLANMQAQNAAGQYLAGAQNQFSTLNQAAQNQALQFGAQAANEAAMQQAASTAAAQQANAAAINQARQYGAGANNQFGLANQGSANQAGQFNAQLGFNVGQANQNATNAAGQFNANAVQNAQVSNQGAGLANQGYQLGASGGLVNTGQSQQGMAFNNANQLWNFGQQVQNLNQGGLNVDYSNRAALANAPMQQVGYAQGVVQQSPYSTGSTFNQYGTGTGTGYSNTQGYQDTTKVGGGFTLSDEKLKENIQPLTGGDDTGDGDVTDDGSGTPIGFGSRVASNAKRQLGIGQPKVPKPAQTSGGGGFFDDYSQKSAGKMLQEMGIFGTSGLSDIRLKGNIRPMTSPKVVTMAAPGARVTAVGNDPMAAVHKLKPVTFNWKGSGQPDTGFIAQNVEQAHPAAVKDMGFGLKGYSLPGVVGLLSEGLKQLDHKVNAQRRGLLA